MSVGGKLWVGAIGLGTALLGAIVMGFGFVESGETVFNLEPIGLVLISVGAAAMALAFAAIVFRWYRQALARDAKKTEKVEK